VEYVAHIQICSGLQGLGKAREAPAFNSDWNWRSYHTYFLILLVIIYQKVRDTWYSYLYVLYFYIFLSNTTFWLESWREDHVGD
jgi:hypothetical protein